MKSKLLSVLITLISFASSVFVAYYIIKTYFWEMLQGNIVATFFIFWLIVIFGSNLVALFRYRVLKLPVPFDQSKLLPGEKILADSAYRLITSKGFMSRGIRFNYIVITNYRLVLAGDIMGFYTYNIMARTIWFNSKVSKAKTSAKGVKLSDDKKSLEIKEVMGSWLVKLDNAEEVYRGIELD